MPTTTRCRTCGVKIKVPEGWTAGPAVRKHYWKKHRDVMTKHLTSAPPKRAVRS